MGALDIISSDKESQMKVNILLLIFTAWFLEISFEYVLKNRTQLLFY